MGFGRLNSQDLDSEADLEIRWFLVILDYFDGDRVRPNDVDSKFKFLVTLLLHCFAIA